MTIELQSEEGTSLAEGTSDLQKLCRPGAQQRQEPETVSVIIAKASWPQDKLKGKHRGEQDDLFEKEATELS